MHSHRLSIWMLIAVWLACGLAEAEHAYKGGDGSSIKKAVAVNAGNKRDGTAAEWNWVQSHYRGWKMKDQSLVESSGRKYDRMTIVSPAGKQKHIFFDPTRYYGK